MNSDSRNYCKLSRSHEQELQVMVKAERIPAKAKEQEKQVPVRQVGMSNSEMIEFLKSQGYLIEKDENENV